MHGLRRNESGLNMSFHCFKIFTAFVFLRVFENIMTKAEVDIHEKYDFILQYTLTLKLAYVMLNQALFK